MVSIMAQSKDEVNFIPNDNLYDLESVKNKFLDKHPSKTADELDKIKEEQREAKKKYSSDIRAVEQNLMGFFKKEYPIVDPESDKVIGYMRQLPYWEMVQLIPEGLLDKNVSDEEKTEKIKGDESIQNIIFDMMERMISVPEHNSEWWKENATPAFIIVFNKAVEDMFKKLESDASFF